MERNPIGSAMVGSKQATPGEHRLQPTVVVVEERRIPLVGEDPARAFLYRSTDRLFFSTAAAAAARMFSIYREIRPINGAAAAAASQSQRLVGVLNLFACTIFLFLWLL